MALRALQGPAGGTAPVGTLGGTTNTIPRWTGPSTLGDSIITQDDGTNRLLVAGGVAAASTAGAPIRINGQDATGPGNLAGGNILLMPGAGSGTGAPGSLGIGTTNPPPSVLVTVSNGGADGFEFDVASNFFTKFNRSTVAFTEMRLRASAFSWFIQTTPAMVLNTSGNVGIGTASPGALLHLSSAATTLRVTSTTSTNSCVMRVEAGGGNVYIGRDSSAGGFSGTASASIFWDSIAQPMVFGTNNTERARIDSSGRMCIGTTTATTGRALTTVADLDVFGVRVGRGGGAQANTCVGNGALESNTTGGQNTAVGLNALYWNTAASLNTAFGYEALRGQSGASTGANNTAVGNSAMRLYTTGAANTAVGRDAAAALTQGGNNVAIGHQAGDSITTGNSNIVIGSGADVAAAGDSNQLVLGDATNYVATNGGATTYYATAGASLGYMRVRLNGTYVKIEVFADV